MASSKLKAFLRGAKARLWPALEQAVMQESHLCFTTCATPLRPVQLTEAGTDLGTVADLLGHSGLRVVVAKYIHPRAKSKSEAVKIRSYTSCRTEGGRMIGRGPDWQLNQVVEKRDAFQSLGVVYKTFIRWFDSAPRLQQLAVFSRTSRGFVWAGEARSARTVRKAHRALGG